MDVGAGWLLWASLLAGLLLAAGEVWLRQRRKPILTTPVEALRPVTASLGWPDVEGRIRLVALGDSIVHGHIVPAEAAWPDRLAARLQREYPRIPWMVINSGICGETAVQGLVRLHRDGLRFRPHVLFIAFGLNDCHLARSPVDAWLEAELFPTHHYGPLGWSRLYRALRRRLRKDEGPNLTRANISDREFVLRGSSDPRFAPGSDDPGGAISQLNMALQPRVGPELFTAALRQMIRRARRAGVKHIYLLTMTPVDEQAPFHWFHWSHWLPELRERQLALCQDYDRRIREAAATLNVGLIDVAAGFAPGDVTQSLADDGIHLTAAGQERLADIVFTALERDGTLRSLRIP